LAKYVPLEASQGQAADDQILQRSVHFERLDGRAMYPSGRHGEYVTLVETYRHLIITIDALPKTEGPEKLVPVVVALKPLP
jgi:hypothetical protein